MVFFIEPTEYYIYCNLTVINVVKSYTLCQSLVCMNPLEKKVDFCQIKSSMQNSQMYKQWSIYCILQQLLDFLFIKGFLFLQDMILLTILGFSLYLPNWQLNPSEKQKFCGKVRMLFGKVGLLFSAVQIYFTWTQQPLNSFVSRFATFQLHSIHTSMVKTKLSQAKRSIPIHAYFIIIWDITFLVFNSQVTDKRVHILNYFTIRQNKKKKKSEVLQDIKGFKPRKVFFGHALFFFNDSSFTAVLRYRLACYFLNTWHRNNWMAIV